MGKKSQKSTTKSKSQSAQQHKNVVSTEASRELEEFSRENAVSAGVGFALLALYVSTLPPTVVGGDSGELIISASELGVAHPPGYPLFTVLTKLSLLLIPCGSPAWRANLLTACFASAAGSLLHATLLRLECGVVGSLIGVAVFCLSQLTWTWSICAEVFSLNNLFVAALLLMAVLFQQAQSPHQTLRIAKIGAFISGLSLCNQHTISLYVVCVAMWVLYKLYKHEILTLKILISLGLYGLLGLLPYLYLPLSSIANTARWTWGSQDSLSGFINHLLRTEYGTFDLGKDQEGSGFLENIWAYWEHAQDHLCYFTPFLSVIALPFALFSKKKASKDVVVLFVVMVTVYTGFFSWRANLDISDPLLKGVVERFWMQTDILLAVLATLGLKSLIRWATDVVTGVTKKNQVAANVAGLLLTLVAALVTFAQLKNYTICDQSKNTMVRDFAQTLFDAIPNNSLVLTKGDLPGNTMRYLFLCENVHPDVQLLDQEILSYRWSLKMTRKFFPKVNFPGDFWHLQNTNNWSDGSTSFNFKSFLQSNYDRFPGGIYVCIGMQDKDSSWVWDFELLPHGVCHKVVKRGTPLDIQKYMATTAPLADNWPYPYTGYSDTSWEKVANDEMWNARISSAFFLYHIGTDNADMQLKSLAFDASYQLYKRALGRHAPDAVPPYWHKNFALACEKLVNLQHGHDKAELLSLSIHHFQVYLQQQQDDPDTPGIQAAIDMLRRHHLMLSQMDQVEQTADRMMERLDRLANVGLPGS